MRINRLYSVAAAVLAALIGIRDARAAQTCTAHSISQLGRCTRTPSAKAAINREIRGLDSPKSVQPGDIDGDMVATQLTGGHAKGEWSHISGSRGDWILVIRKGAVSSDGEAQIVSASYDAPPLMIALARITPSVDHKAKVNIIATTDRIWSDAAGEPPCVDPEDRKGEEFNSSGGYPDLSGIYRWITLSPKNRVLAATVARSEGYAGGGGTFTGTVLLAVQRGRLIRIACYATSRYQMFGGDWNADGTRQHPESTASWTMVPGRQGIWPALRLVPVTKRTPAAAMVWDPAQKWYQMKPERHHSEMLVGDANG